MYVLGGTSKTTFLATEGEKIAVEFEAAVALKHGQPVKLTADGKVTAWAKGDLLHTLIGYVYAPEAAAIGDLATVITRGFAIINGISTGALATGPVAYQGYDAATDVDGTTGYNQYANSATAAENNGWALDAAAGAGEIVRVLLQG
jgi:hypothetical protein